MPRARATHERATAIVRITTETAVAISVMRECGSVCCCGAGRCVEVRSGVNDTGDVTMVASRVVKSGSDIGGV